VDSSGTAIYIAHTDARPTGCAHFASDLAPARHGAAMRSDIVERRSSGSVPDLYPANLLAGGSSAVRLPACGLSKAIASSWWLAHTLPRQEKAVAAALFARNIPYYLPLVTRKSLSRGRTRVARVTLFPGYVFLYGHEEQRLSALKTNRLLTVREAPDGERLRADLEQFSRLIAADAPLLPEARLVEGERVQVKSGPFRELEGTVLRRNGKTRLLIAIDYLQQGASLEVDDCLLVRV
jgi:transcriptional antiterminator NusG